MQKFDTPAPVPAVLDIPAGRIRLLATDRAETRVEVLPADAGKSRDVKAAERIEVSFRDGVLRIEAPEAEHGVLGTSGSVEVTVHLPAGSSVEAKAASAELRSEGRLGDVTFEGARATVALDETADTRLTVADGDLSVARLTGPGELRAQKGDLTVAEATKGLLTLHTESGRISVGAAPGVSASLDARTAYGRITNTLRNSDGAAAGLTIHATTSHGDITARGL
ncbi:DUF4097 family beta strand repeat-containing protein [Streptomyces sp. NPDC102406]|uniref:DUF4097 family beta strand repeat-containing protein n=1 Tax=Streptomyces sp. NPDC102406 TaxID=3366171 RepID=UPI003812FB8B